MKLFLSRLPNTIVGYLTTKYTPPTRTPTANEGREASIHSLVMLEIASVLNDIEYVDIKGINNVKDMWDKFLTIHKGDEHALKVKFDSLKGKYDEMNM